MNIDAAKNLVTKVLKNAYDEENFRELVHNLFDNYTPLQEHPVSGAYIWDSFKEHIISYKRLAKYETNGQTVDVLAVCVQNGSKLEHARTMLRNFISKYLNAGRGGKLRDAALVAFYAPDSTDWRLSLVKMDYNYDVNKQKIENVFTPARRYSFLVGTNEQVHTACKQFLDVLVTGGNPTLHELEKIFSIETVSNEFFEKYKELFLRLAESIDSIRQKDIRINSDFELNNITTQLFCKKLLGQIVFLYFLQKKGWLGVDKDQPWGTGRKDFLRSLFTKAVNNGENYFDAYLEHLFYEALAIKRPDSYFERLGCRIPFLNGGLFEPIQGYKWDEYKIMIPNDIFSNSNSTKEGDIGDGILDVFDRYNFTVREDEMLEKEVAVDPEMLGKVFENLLEVNDRKSKGAFYTPREIVHFMCQESLINYLYNKVNCVQKELAQDQQPSFCVFPKQQLTLAEDICEERVSKQALSDFIRYGDIFREHERASGKNNTGTYEHKIAPEIKKYAEEIDQALADVLVLDPAIGSGAFPVGMMNEIVRARLNLLEYGYICCKGDIRNSYTYKRHAIERSLYGVDIEDSAVEIAKLRFWLSLIVDEYEPKSINPLPNLDYKIRCANSLLRIQRSLFNAQDIVDLERWKDEFVQESDGRKKKGLKTKIDDGLAKLAKDGEFDYNLFFSEVFRSNAGFDIVIGNPPYVQLQTMKNDFIKRGVYAGKSFQDLYREQNFKTFIASGDIYCLFYEKGISLLRNRGTLCYITSNKWMCSSYGEKLREILIQYNPKLLIDLGAGIFPTAVVDTNILLVEKKGYEGKTLSCEYKDRKQDMSVSTRQNAMSMKFTKDSWAILDAVEQSIKEKIEKYGTPLKEWGINIYRGVLTGCNDAFIIDGAKRAELIAADPKSDEIIRPILRGRDIKRYGYDFADLWLINIECGSTNANRCSLAPEEYIKSTYPAIYEHFVEIANKPTRGKGLKGRDDMGDYWWELRSCAYTNDFSKQKIVYGQFRRGAFALDTQGCFLSSNEYFIWTDQLDLKYLLGLLNSRVCYYYGCVSMNSLGGATTIAQKDIFIKFPIMEPDETTKQKIIELVDKILDRKSNGLDPRDLEEEINNTLYDMYGFSDEEREAIVEITSQQD